MRNQYIIYSWIAILFALTVSASFFSDEKDRHVVIEAAAPEMNDIPRQRSVPYFTEKNLHPSFIDSIKLKNHHTVTALNYDVVVVGSDPEGIAAAIAAAREGQKTLLLDTNEKVGGLFTLGKLNMLDLNLSPTGERLTQGIFEEFFQAVNQRTSFDVNDTEEVFNTMLASEELITLDLGAKAILPVMNGPHVEAMIYQDSNGFVKKIKAPQFIDATPDADFANLAGAEFTVGQEDFRGEPRMMAVTLVFELAGVNWRKVVDYLNGDDEFYTGADQHSAWGYGQEMAQYKPSQEQMRIRALNIGKQNNGNVLINAFQVLDVNGLDAIALEDARRRAERELPRIVSFLRSHLSGFENVKLVGTADSFYIRETRHLEAEYKLTIDDVLEHRDFDDRIAFGSYPIDVQATILGEGDIILGNPAQYAIPFRSIVPKDFDNLVVASRSAGYDSLAHASARTVPVGMVVGQAAGTAAAYANQQKLTFQDIIADRNGELIRGIQSILNKNGANLAPIPAYDNPIVNHWAYEGVKLLRRYAIISAGYDNEYKLDEPLSKEKFVDCLRLLNQYTGDEQTIHFPFARSSEPVTATDIGNFLQANSWKPERLSDITRDKLQQQQTAGELTRDVLYMVIKEVLQK